MDEIVAMEHIQPIPGRIVSLYLDNLIRGEPYDIFCFG